RIARSRPEIVHVPGNGLAVSHKGNERSCVPNFRFWYEQFPLYLSQKPIEGRLVKLEVQFLRQLLRKTRPGLLSLSIENQPAHAALFRLVFGLGQDGIHFPVLNLNDRIAGGRPNWLRDGANLQVIGRLLERRVRLVEAEIAQRPAAVCQRTVGKDLPGQILEPLALLEPRVE